MNWNRRRTVLLVVLLIVIAIPAWWLASPLVIVRNGMEATPPAFATVVASGGFVNGEPGHHALGRGLVLTDGASFLVRTEDFSVTNGPDIHVFLARGARVASGDIDLGSVRVTQGSANYPVPAGVDPRAYTYIVIWCVPFSVQFGYAEIAAR